MDSFPGNSRRPLNSQQPQEPNSPPAVEKKLASVVTGKVIRRKKPIGRRILDVFAGEGGVLSYLLREVLVPAIRDTAADFVIQGIEKAAYGEVRTNRRTSGGYRGSSAPPRHISYDRPTSIIRSPLNSSVPAPSRRALPATAPMDTQEIIVDDQITAQVILERLYETIEEYGVATVANLKELLGETAVYTDHKWGWREDAVAVFNMKRIREGYLLIIPDPVDLR
jgi:hypothetical protein